MNLSISNKNILGPLSVTNFVAFWAYTGNVLLKVI